MEAERRAYTIREFCDAHRISISTYYNLPVEERPDELRVNARVIITDEAAAEWRRKGVSRTAAARRDPSRAA